MITAPMAASKRKRDSKRQSGYQRLDPVNPAQWRFFGAGTGVNVLDVVYGSHFVCGGGHFVYGI